VAGAGAGDVPNAPADSDEPPIRIDKSSRSAGPQKRTKAPRCRLTRCARGYEPAVRTLPRLSSYESSLALPCSRPWSDERPHYGEGGALALPSNADAVIRPRERRGRVRRSDDASLGLTALTSMVTWPTVDPPILPEAMSTGQISTEPVSSVASAIFLDSPDTIVDRGRDLFRDPC